MPVPEATKEVSSPSPDSRFQLKRRISQSAAGMTCCAKSFAVALVMENVHFPAL